MKRLLVTLAFLGASAPLFAQTGPRAVDFQQIPPVAKTVSLAGPRFGVTLLTDQMVGKLKTDAGISVHNGISQFGWQFERQFYTKDDGPTVLNEWVLLAGGLDQGVFLPSLNWLVGAHARRCGVRHRSERIGQRRGAGARGRHDDACRSIEHAPELRCCSLESGTTCQRAHRIHASQVKSSTTGHP